MEQVEIKPEGGQWTWRHVDDDKTEVASGSCEDRTTAIAEGRKAAGGRRVMQTDTETGEEVGETQLPTTCRVVLLRPDGSEYGELDPGPQADGPAQEVDIEPVETNEGTS